MLLSNDSTQASKRKEGRDAQAGWPAKPKAMAHPACVTWTNNHGCEQNSTHSGQPVSRERAKHTPLEDWLYRWGTLRTTLPAHPTGTSRPASYTARTCLEGVGRSHPSRDLHPGECQCRC